MSNHMISARQQPVGVESLNVGMSSERGHLSQNLNQNQTQQEGPQGVQLNKKFSGHNRKRNAREKSYDLYNQKLQLPPMQKAGQDSLNMGSSTVTSRGNNPK